MNRLRVILAQNHCAQLPSPASALGQQPPALFDSQASAASHAAPKDSIPHTNGERNSEYHHRQLTPAASPPNPHNPEPTKWYVLPKIHHPDGPRFLRFRDATEFKIRTRLWKSRGWTGDDRQNAGQSADPSTQTTRPTVTIIGADGKASGNTAPLPAVFKAPIRPDIVQSVWW